MGLDDIELAQHGVRLLQLGMIDPIEPHALNGFASGLQKIIVVEDKRPFIETAVRDQLYDHNKGGPLIVGKRNIGDGPVFPSNDELTADTIAPVLARNPARTQCDSPGPGVARRAPITEIAGGASLDHSQPLFLFGVSAQFVDEGA